MHVHLFSDPAHPDQATMLLQEFARRPAELGGTVSAEHGVGKRKAALQYAPEHLERMRAVKRRLNPANILGRSTMWGLGKNGSTLNAANLEFH